MICYNTIYSLTILAIVICVSTWMIQFSVTHLIQKQKIEVSFALHLINTRLNEKLPLEELVNGKQWPPAMSDDNQTQRPHNYSGIVLFVSQFGDNSHQFVCFDENQRQWFQISLSPAPRLPPPGALAGTGKIAPNVCGRSISSKTGHRINDTVSNGGETYRRPVEATKVSCRFLIDIPISSQTSANCANWCMRLGFWFSKPWNWPGPEAIVFCNAYGTDNICNCNCKSTTGGRGCSRCITVTS